MSGVRNILSWPSRRPARAGALAGWFQQACGLGVAVLLIPIVTRFLPPDQAGIWFSFQGLVSMIALLDLGFGFAIARQAAFTLGASEATVARHDFIPLVHGWIGVGQLFRLTRVLYRWLAVSAALVALAAFEVFSRFGNLVPPETPGVRWCWYGMAGTSVLLILAAGDSSFLNGLGAVYQTRFLSGFYQLFAGAGAALAAWQGWGLAGMGLSFAICAAFYKLAVVLVRHLTTTPMREKHIPSPPAGSLGRLARAALPVGGVNVFGSMVYTIQTPLLGFLLGPEKVASFYLAQKIAMACNMAALQPALPQLPFFTRLLGSDNFSGARDNMKKTIVRTTFLVLAGAGAFYLFSPIAASVLLHRETYVDKLTLFLIAMDISIVGCSVIWGHYVLASGKNPFVFSTICTGAASLVGSMVLISSLGMAGLPAATILAGLLFNCRKNVTEGIKVYRSLGA